MTFPRVPVKTKTHMKDSLPMKLRLSKNSQKMEIDSEVKADGGTAFELEDSLATIDEAQNPVATANAGEALRNEMLDLPFPKVALEMTGIKLTCVEQVLLLGAMDTHRLMESPNHKNDFCEHCGVSMKFQWKAKGTR